MPGEHHDARISDLTGGAPGESLAQRFKLFRFGEVDWTALIAAVTAAFGIISGYCLYVLWWEHDEKGESGWTFAVAFAVAAGMSFIFEALRTTIEGSPHRWTRSRVVSTVVMLAAFELFIIATHGAAEMDRCKFVGVAGFIFGERFAPNMSAGENVLALGLLWIAVALTIAYSLRRFILKWPYSNSGTYPKGPLPRFLSAAGPDMWRGSMAGLRAGVIWGPLMAVAYVFVLRAIGLAQDLHANPDHNPIAGDNPVWRHLPRFLEPFIGVPLTVVLWFTRSFGPWGLVLGIILASLGARAITSKEKRDIAVLVPTAAVLLVLIAPILTEPGAMHDFGSLAILSAVIWGLPAMLLGGLSPLLRRPAYSPPTWGLVAAAAACVLMVLTLARFLAASASGAERTLLALGTLALLGLALVLFRGSWVEEFWLLVALSIGTILWGTTAVAQKANLFEMQRNAHTLIALPVSFPSKSATDFEEAVNQLRRSVPVNNNYQNHAVQNKNACPEDIAGSAPSTEKETRQTEQAQRLELVMTSSLGFWVTIGMLAIWRLTDPEGNEEG